MAWYLAFLFGMEVSPEEYAYLDCLRDDFRRKCPYSLVRQRIQYIRQFTPREGRLWILSHAAFLASERGPPS